MAVGAFGIFLWFPPSKHDTFIFMLLEESLKHHSLLLSDLHEVAAFVAVGVLGGQSECRAGEVQLAFALLSALRDSIFSKFGNIYLLETYIFSKFGRQFLHILFLSTYLDLILIFMIILLSP